MSLEGQYTWLNREHHKLKCVHEVECDIRSWVESENARLRAENEQLVDIIHELLDTVKVTI